MKRKKTNTTEEVVHAKAEESDPADNPKGDTVVEEKSKRARKSSRSKEESTEATGTLSYTFTNPPSKHVKYLIKSEPEDYSIDDIKKAFNEIGRYDGVRNYQARNHIRLMQPGDLIFFYHSNIKKETGIYGIIEVVGSVYLDPTALDSKHKLYDSTCKEESDITKAKWLAFDMKIIERWDKAVLLSTLKKVNENQGIKSPFKNMMLFKNSRLSVQLVTDEESDAIIQMHGTND